MKTKLRTQTQTKTNCWIYRCVSTVIASLLLGSATFTVRAQEIVSFDILAGTLADHNVMDPINDFAGAPGVRTNYWNLIGNYLNGGTGTADVTLPGGGVSITNSAGQVVLNLQVTVHTAGDGYADRNTLASGGDAKMQSDIIDCARGFSAGYNLGYIDFTNIPYTNYNIYCYTLTTEAGSGVTKTRGGFWIITNTPSGIQRIYNRSQSNDVAYTQIPALTTANATNGGYVRATTTSIPGGGTSWDSINGGNYGVFTGLTNSHTRVYFGALSTSSQKDDLGNWVNPATGGDTNPRFKQAGFQIVQVLPIAATPTNIAFIGASPTNLLLGSTFTFPLSVEAKYSDGTSNDVTLATGIGYISGNTNIFNVSGSGLISPGLQAGVTNLIASFTGSWGTLYATNSVTVLAPTNLNLVLDRTNLFVGKNGVIDFTSGHLFAGFNDPVYTNVNVTAFHGVNLSSLTPAIISVANSQITAINVGTFGINGSYGGLSENFNSAGTAQYFMPVGNPGISMKLTDSLPPSSHAMIFTSLAGVPGGEVNAPNVTGLGVRLPYWNNLVIPNGRSFPTNSIGVTNAVLDSGGNIVSNLVAVFAAPTAAGITESGSPTTNESLLFDTYFDNGLNDSTQPTTANAGFIIVSNVPYAHYDVFVYVQDDGSSRAAQFTCEGQIFIRANYGSALVPASDGTGYYEAIDTVLPTPSSPIAIGSIDPGNTIHFQNITNSTLTVNFAACATNTVTGAIYPNTIPRLRLVGFQIVERLDGLTATNLYLSPGVPSLTTNGTPYSLRVLANFNDGTLGGIVTTLPGIAFSSDNTSIFMVDARGVITPGATIGTANLTVNYTNSTDSSVVTLTTPVTTQTAISTAPVTIKVTSGGGNLSFSWPGDHLGWRLVTNSVGLTATNDWFTYPGSSSVTNINVPIGTSGNVFFRLTYP